MRKMIVSDFVTLDGLLSGQDDETDWFRWSDEIEQYTKEFMRSLDAIVFGRRTYECLARYWPTEESAGEDPSIRHFMNSVEKVVFSKTLETGDWPNTSLIREVDTETVLELKKRPGKDMVIYGSGSLVGELTDLGLIDEYRMFINPVILGLGRRVFGDNTKRHDFELLETRAFDNGVVLLRYRPGSGSEPATPTPPTLR